MDGLVGDEAVEHQRGAGGGGGRWDQGGDPDTGGQEQDQASTRRTLGREGQLSQDQVSQTS